MALVAIFVLGKWRQSPTYALDETIYDFLKRPIDFPFLQSEGMIPSFLAIFWAKCVFFGGQRNNYELMSVINTIIAAQNSRNRMNQLPSPYYEFEEVVRWRFKEYLGQNRHELDRDSNYHRSWYLYSLILMLVRRNFKQTVKYFWPEATRFVHLYTALEDEREFPFAKSDSASEHSFYLKIPANWSDLIGLTKEVPPPLPSELTEDPILLLLLCLYLPHRMSPGIISWLDRTFSPKCWY